MAPGPVWTGAENLAPTGFRSPDRPARSQSPYRLSYPAHNLFVIVDISCPRSRMLTIYHINDLESYFLTVHTGVLISP